MEESSNGGLEETLKVAAHDEVKHSAALKADVDGKDFSSSSSSSDEEAEPDKEESPPNQQENLEKFEEEKVVSGSVDVERVVSLTEEFGKDTEPSVEKSVDSDVAELESKETEENISAYLDETNTDSPVLTDLPRNGLKAEPDQKQLSSAEDSALPKDVESKGIDEETRQPSLDETNGSAVTVDVVSKGIEESTISSLSENVGAPAAAVDQGIKEREIPVSDNRAEGSSGSPDLASKDDHVEDSLRATNVPVVETREAGELENKPENPESTGNQPILSLNRRPEQPTSWRSCCGLFEVLRRSDR